MNRLYFIPVMLIILAGTCRAQIQVRLSNPPGRVTPGGHFTLFFDLKSGSPLPDSVSESIDLPEKWNLLSKRKPEIVKGQTALRYFYVIGTPADCIAGIFQIRFRVKVSSQETDLEVPVQLEKVRKLELFVVSKPEFIKEGDTLRIDYLVQNAGNMQEKFTVKTSRGGIASVTDSVTLLPRSKMNITVRQRIPFTESNAWQSSSDITLLAGEGGQTLYETVSIPVFSSKIRKIDRWFRFPVEVGGGYLFYQFGNRTLAAFQYNAIGRGFMDQKNTHYIDFTVRGPNQFVFPAIGSYDQYSLEYQYKNKTKVAIGDYGLQLNNLIEFGRFGRGVRLEQQFSKTDYMLFFQKARFFPNQKESAGGRVNYKITPNIRVGLSHASKNIVFRDRAFWSHLSGVSAGLNAKSFQLETELAAGHALGKRDYAGFLRFQLSQKRFTATGNAIYAGKNFYGFYNNSLYLNTNIGFNITNQLTLGVAGNFSDVNPSLDANFYSVSPRDRSYTAFVTYQPSAKNRLFLFYSQQERQDRQTPATFHYSENFGNLSYHYEGKKFKMFYQGRYGFSRNLLVFDNSGKKESISNMAQPGMRLFPWLWASGYFEHQHTSKFSRADVVENLFFYGGNARVHLGQYIHASVLYRNNYAPDELFTRRSYLDVSVAVELQRHKFSFSAGQSHVPNRENRDQNILFMNLRYALKLNVPVSRKRNIGRVSGKLSGTGFSKQGNLVQLGSHKFLTDTSGVFFFDGVAPDQYYLSISQNESKNDGVVPGIKMPMFIHVKADSVNVIDIPFTRTGGIAGNVQFVKGDKNGVASILTEKPSVLVKLYNETASFLTELNEKGEFSFKEMKPGTWNITAFIPGNQDRFVIDEGNRTLELRTDQTMDIVFRVRPNEKRIHFSEKSFDLSVKK